MECSTCLFILFECAVVHFCRDTGSLFIDLTDTARILLGNNCIVIPDSLRYEAEEYSMTDVDGLRNNETPLQEKLDSIWID